MPRVYMRGDYYVVPPNGARIHTCVRTLLSIAGLGGPEAKQRARFSLDFYIFIKFHEMLSNLGFALILGICFKYFDLQFAKTGSP